MPKNPGKMPRVELIAEDPILLPTVSRKSKESVRAFISRQKGMFKIRMYIQMKRQEIEALQDSLKKRQAKYDTSLARLTAESTRLDNLERESDMDLLEAIKRHDKATADSMALRRLLHDTTSHFLQLHRGLGERITDLKSCTKAKDFLHSLAPPGWKPDSPPSSPLHSVTSPDPYLPLRALARDGPDPLPPIGPNTDPTVLDALNLLHNTSSQPRLPFQAPQQVTDLFRQLEDTNLMLLGGLQSLQMVVETARANIKVAERDRARLTARLQSQARALQGRQKEEGEGLVTEEDLDRKTAELGVLRRAIQAACLRAGMLHEDLAGLESGSLLARLERELQGQQALIATFPEGIQEAAARRQARRRREARRASKMARQKAQQEERRTRSLARATAPCKKNMGRPLMARSYGTVRRQTERNRRQQEQLTRQVEGGETATDGFYGIDDL
eukprot:gnl/Dysnectes_brevis/3630_a4625_1015.p1 GENE.gnl/Dysnectes_brevis/3630_a4625_1015~~gnl/Dysnectes_brevis/3630_a4625_1015.p1  ORF type:complete len:445 (-),score=34.99 gnl/Dysnectes_brevis/3630_a4625_1015:145-1479(-)